MGIAILPNFFALAWNLVLLLTYAGHSLGSLFTSIHEGLYVLPGTGPFSRVEGLKWGNASASFSTLSFFRSEETVADHLESGLEAIGLRIGMDPVKNRTIIAEARFQPGDFICEYAGEGIEQAELDRRKNIPPAKARYAIQFTYEETDTFILDAPEDTENVCRLINHSIKRNNVDFVPVFFKKSLRFVFYASRTIEMGEELLLDYGYAGMTPEELREYSWLSE